MSGLKFLKILGILLDCIKLLLPALLPSWKFFNYIAPSPRVQYALFDSNDKIINEWYEFRPRPAYVSFLTMLKRLCWNPYWNESLFILSCAERITISNSVHAENEILSRMVQDWREHKLFNSRTAQQIQFRLLLIKRVNNELHQHVHCYSKKIAASLHDI